MANPIERELTWWRWWIRRNRPIVLGGLFISIVVFALFFHSRDSVDLPDVSVSSNFVDLTLVHSAKSKGALCLDGSLPGYHLQRGFGSGIHDWLLHIEGGGWCNSVESCSRRQKTPLGSSDYMERQVVFSGILSQDKSQNPDFHNWNKVKIRYCDGASFAGHPENEFKNGTRLFFRGQLIWETIMEELLSVGLSDAKKALLSGCSAGGLATLIHCDEFRDILPKDAIVKCLADAGFFINEKDVTGRYTMQSFYQDVIQLQGVAKSLPKDCIKRVQSKCLFPQEIIKSRRTPIFIVNPAYDFWQIQNILVSHSTVESAPYSSWYKCRLNLQHCDASQMEILHGFRNSLMNALDEFQKNDEGGLFINSCFIHCQTWMAGTWHSPNSPKIRNKTIAEAVGDWYFNRGAAKLIDCPYACNPTCLNMDFTRS